MKQTLIENKGSNGLVARPTEFSLSNPSNEMIFKVTRLAQTARNFTS